MPDGILWMPTKSYVDFKTRMELVNQPLTDEIKDSLYKQMFYYKADDLIKIMINIKDMADIWFTFRCCLRARHPQRAELFHQLCARPRIRQELDRRNRETTPPAPLGS
jgi:hypothetical protein